jgi:hypothetical protein
MNKNRIGKGLVLIHTAASLIALSWALGVFLQFTDWGWTEPRSEFGFRVPSEYDKRAASFKDAVKTVAATVPYLAPARTAWHQAEERFGANHLFYVEELARLHGSTEATLVVKPVKMAGEVVLDTPRIGKPAFDEPIKEVTKSYASYVADLKALNDDIQTKNKELREWTEKAEKITALLNAKDKDGQRRKDAVGIYDLLEVEKKAQDQADAEKEYLQPIWAQARNEAAALSARQDSWQQVLDRLKKSK